MKKIFFILLLGAASLMSASNLTTEKYNVNVGKKALLLGPIPRIYNGFLAYDDPEKGTCFIYGTYKEWDYGNGIILWEFKSASRETQLTVVTPPCTGPGSYLA
ncbi:hypothetical protein [Amniculibacterium aquaticum]|uniref:hypothetical protein n=1 Tax=Amniculibacterium aquaticum TaxID=2479858 RepID=UPI000F5B7BE6|nr:hypothetical protein [Amniculibacterium aquaticum]